MNDFTLAIDPGAHAGWALFQGKRYVASDHVRIKNPCDVNKAIGTVICETITHGCPVPWRLVVEDQFPNPAASWASTKTFVRTSGWWEALWAPLWSIEFRDPKLKPEAHYVMASAWQSKLLGSFPKGKDGTKAREETTKRVASSIAGRSITEINEACAVCLGSYFCNRQWLVG